MGVGSLQIVHYNWLYLAYASVEKNLACPCDSTLYSVDSSAENKMAITLKKVGYCMTL